jgi:hypothetical protein
MKIVCRFDVGLGAVHGAIDLVIALGECGEVGVGDLQLVDQVGLTGEIVAKLVRGIGHRSPFIEVTV